jgi:hypothetical protein
VAIGIQEQEPEYARLDNRALSSRKQ